jgi:hypothetical protein
MQIDLTCMDYSDRSIPWPGIRFDGLLSEDSPDLGKGPLDYKKYFIRYLRKHTPHNALKLM